MKSVAGVARAQAASSSRPSTTIDSSALMRTAVIVRRAGSASGAWGTVTTEGAGPAGCARANPGVDNTNPLRISAKPLFIMKGVHYDEVRQAVRLGRSVIVGASVGLLGPVTRFSIQRNGFSGHTSQY
jgi:hypothetical protein